MSKIYTFSLTLDNRILIELGNVERFGGSWVNIEKREGRQTLKELKSIATVASVGASTRIEGSRMTNDEVKTFIFDQLKSEKLRERDQQEVLGYYQALDTISASYQDIAISENEIKNLHNILMKFSEKDQWHKGQYKKHPNSVEATNPDGSKTRIFDTSAPGFPTDDAMRALVEWYRSDTTTHPIIKSAVFVYDFLSIHPFQDGNGRLSRLLATLLLLQNGYSWVEYVSFEHEIEIRKKEYYNALMECQQKRPGENVYSWVVFFLDCLNNIQNKLNQKLEVQKGESALTPREKKIFRFIENHPGSKSGEISEKLSIPLPSVKKILSEMVKGGFIKKYGTGTGTNYTTESVTTVKENLVFTLTDKEPEKEFILMNKHSFLELKKIILGPKFEWKKPDDWGSVLFKQELMLHVKCVNSKGKTITHPYFIASFDSEYYFQPVFTLPSPIHIPGNFWDSGPYDIEYPIKVTISLTGKTSSFDFDVKLVYDSAFV